MHIIIIPQVQVQLSIPSGFFTPQSTYIPTNEKVPILKKYDF